MMMRIVEQLQILPQRYPGAISFDRRDRNDRMTGASVRRGFTLIEMMVVIGLVGLLLTITIMVTQGVVAQSKVRQCRELLAGLDSLITEYESEYGSMPSFNKDLFSQPKDGESGEVRPEVATFLEQVHGLAGADRIIAGWPTQYLMKRNDYYGQVGTNSIFAGSIDDRNPLDANSPNGDDRLTLADPWGMEILYIHPRDKMATIGKNAPHNFAGYGTPVNDRPYFISAGPDRIFYDKDITVANEDSHRKDNIYSYEGVERPEEQ